MDPKIISFLKSERNLTICTVSENVPYCASCFYSFLERENMLVFKSAIETKHVLNAMLNARVAGTIIPDIIKIENIKGIQFTGKFVIPDNNLVAALSKSYYYKFPFALTMKGELWAIELLEIKMTNNTLGFGKNISWSKPDSSKAITR